MSSGPNTRSGGSGGSLPFTAEQLVEVVGDNRISINWSRLFRGGIGGIIYAFWQGLISLPVSLATAWETVIDGLKQQLNTAAVLLFDVPLSSISTVWRTADVEVFGVVAQPVTLVASLATLAVFAWVTYQWLGGD